MKNKLPFMVLAKPIGPVCNLRCEYCFYLTKEELFKHQKRSEYIMKDDILEAFIGQYIDAQPEGVKEVSFAWQGGEPTMLSQKFYEKVLILQDKYKKPGMLITNAIQTNGTLITKERAKWLAANKFLVGISIDGDEPLHDRYRKDPDGNGTFHRVMAGINNLLAAGAKFNTLTVVQNDNGNYPERIYDFLKQTGSTFFQFIPIVEPISGGGVSSRTVAPKQWGSFMNGIFDRWAASDIGKIYVQHFDTLLGIYAGYPSSLCVHSTTCGMAPAIEHDGSLYSCDHFVSEKNKLGSVLDSSIAEMVYGEQQYNFGQRKKTLLSSDCKKCDWLPLCNGGCPKNRIVNKKDGKLNYLCQGYKEFYSHSAPYFQAMTKCLENKVAPAYFRDYFNFKDLNIGRNDPCPCFSGKKYKHCHGK